ncbi:hypothetical protein HV336_14935 [Citrobacter freundii]|nr:hypothetical protein HV336_14935 [Citrobacter freundii]
MPRLQKSRGADLAVNFYLKLTGCIVEQELRAGGFIHPDFALLFTDAVGHVVTHHLL